MRFADNNYSSVPFLFSIVESYNGGLFNDIFEGLVCFGICSFKGGKLILSITKNILREAIVSFFFFF